VSGSRCVAYAVTVSLFLIVFFSLIILFAIKPLQSSPLMFTLFLTLMLILLLFFLAIFTALGAELCREDSYIVFYPRRI